MFIFSKKIILIILFLIITMFFGVNVVFASTKLAIDGGIEPEISEKALPRGIGNWKNGLISGQPTQYNQTGDVSDPTARLITYIRFITYFVTFLAVTFTIRIVWAGYLWMTAGGNEEKVAEARKTITHAAIGVILMVGLYALTYFVVYQTAFITGFTF